MLPPSLIEASSVAAAPNEWAMPVLPSPSSQVDSASKIVAKRDLQPPLLLPLLQADPSAAATTKLPQTLSAPGSTNTAALGGDWWSTAGLNDSDVGEVATGNRSVERFAVLKLDFQKVATPFFISFWILVASIAKMGELRPCAVAVPARTAATLKPLSACIAAAIVCAILSRPPGTSRSALSRNVASRWLARGASQRL